MASVNCIKDSSGNLYLLQGSIRRVCVIEDLRGGWLEGEGESLKGVLKEGFEGGDLSRREDSRQIGVCKSHLLDHT